MSVAARHLPANSLILVLSQNVVQETVLSVVVMKNTLESDAQAAVMVFSL